MKKHFTKFASMRAAQVFLSFCFILFLMNTTVKAETVTYTIQSKSSVSTSGTAPSGSLVTYNQTFATACQITKNNSMTFTLSGYEGYIIKGITLSMKSNTSGGAGYYSMVVGSTTLSSIATSTNPAAFNNSAWHGSWSTSYVDVTPSMTNNNYTIGAGENVVITIAATANSLYCQSITLTYEAVPKHTITFNPGTGTCATASAYVNAIDLSTITATPSSSCQASGYVFVGWSESAVAETNTEPTMVSDSYMPTGDITLYAVYKLDGGAANTASKNFSEFGFDDGRTMQNDEPHAINSVVSVAFNQGENSNANVPAYYDAGAAVRCYLGNYFKVKSSVAPIRSITLTFSSGGSSPSVRPITANIGTYTDGADEGFWTGSADSVTFTVGGTGSGRRHLAGITVHYGQNFDIVYNTNPVCVHTLNIAYLKTDGTAVDADYTRSVGTNLPYNVTSPQITGYVADRSIVSGTMPNSDVYDTVTYYLVTVAIDSIFNCETEGTGGITVTAPTTGFEYSLDGTDFQSSPVFTNLDADNYTLYIRPIGQTYNYTGNWTVTSNINAPSNPNYEFTINGSDAYGSLGTNATSTTVTLTDPVVIHFMSNFINNYGVDSVTLTNDAPAEYTSIGDYTVNWTATDRCGNTATTSITVHIAVQTCSGVTDYDGNNYQTVTVGSKCWMAENLRTTRYADGRSITNTYVYSNSDYPDTAANVVTFGRLYDWYDALDSNIARTRSPYVQGICPADWHIPSEADFQDLSTVELNSLRSTNYWLTNPGSNSTGFNMRPGGMYNFARTRYENLLGNAYFWSSEDVDASTAHCHMVDCHCYMIYDLIRPKTDAYSVRCVKND
jgi:uncharacterized protein (TIGR02145 family)/uncharacterized repeat protein (TIGR02543 family)